MKIFVGYGYNEQDAWIEKDVFPILRAMSLEVTHGKDTHGEVLQEAVKNRIYEADALIGFATRDNIKETRILIRTYGFGMRCSTR